MMVAKFYMCRTQYKNFYWSVSKNKRENRNLIGENMADSGVGYLMQLVHFVAMRAFNYFFVKHLGNFPAKAFISNYVIIA